MVDGFKGKDPWPMLVITTTVSLEVSVQAPSSEFVYEYHFTPPVSVHFFNALGRTAAFSGIALDFPH